MAAVIVVGDGDEDQTFFCSIRGRVSGTKRRQCRWVCLPTTISPTALVVAEKGSSGDFQGLSRTFRRDRLHLRFRCVSES
jgi:hypothetical protein